jgi:polar amino acid transport system substrate-binding protein
MRSLKSLRRLSGALIIGALTLAAGSALAEPPKTIEPGKLTIGFNGDMPMTSWKDGKLIGTDGALLAQIAANLGLEVNPQQMEWSALIQATKQGKVDIMLGSMGWTKDRTKIMLLTDPIYYFGTFLLQKKATSYSTFADMKGHSVGTVTGFTLVPELKSVPGIGEVKL